MKTVQLSRINWIVIGVYALLGIIIIIETSTMQTDAAGRGMAWGFILVGGIYVFILTVLNMIRVRWMKFVTLTLALIPLVLFLLNS